MQQTAIISQQFRGLRRLQAGCAPALSLRLRQAQLRWHDFFDEAWYSFYQNKKLMRSTRNFSSRRGSRQGNSRNWDTLNPNYSSADNRNYSRSFDRDDNDYEEFGTSDYGTSSYSGAGNDYDRGYSNRSYRESDNDYRGNSDSNYGSNRYQSYDRNENDYGRSGNHNYRGDDRNLRERAGDRIR
jgi:hypothetical protein